MKQVYAFGDDKSTLIDDDSDEREPAFYVDQTLVNFDEKDVGKAWRSEDTETPFGFEYISRAVFREVNFGTDDEYGERVSIDGKELPRKGFLICRHCGKLQPEKGNRSMLRSARPAARSRRRTLWTASTCTGNSSRKP